MNMKFLTVVKSVFFIALLTSLSSFIDKPKAERFDVDTKASTLVWNASKVTGTHTGTAPISAGTLTLEGKNITQGSFEIDLSNLTVTDITNPDGNAKLVGHLKSDDFFSTTKFPKSTFTITSATPDKGNDYKVKGDLTIKGITKEIEFPATIVRDGKKINATAKVTVDRTQFDIHYRSKNFFENLGDKAIDDQFTLDLKLVANIGGV
jgi:polyisoprenoid-binding protein YceI